MTDSTLLRQTPDAGDADGLARLRAEDPSLAGRPYQWGAACRIGPCPPIGYLAQARFNGYADPAGHAAGIALLNGSAV